jgi:RND superfamily putative drug exporter
VAIAVALDALVIRPVLLPAAAALLGRHGWWPTGRPERATPAPSPAAGAAGRSAPHR